jgi:uncharacterized RDD family membrane protein YckC
MKTLRLLIPAAPLLAALLFIAGTLAAQQETTTPAGDAPPEAVVETNEAAKLAEEPSAALDAEPAKSGKEDRQWLDRQAVVVFGRDAELKANESAEAVVVIGGSARVLGKVRDSVVTIGGDADVQGEVGNTVVAVMGSVKAGRGARIDGEVVTVGGRLEVSEGAQLRGRTQEVELGLLGFGRPDWARDWFRHSLLMARPFAPQVNFLWFVAGICFLVYLGIAILFPAPVRACVLELAGRPATTFFIGLLTIFLLPLALLLLAITGVGLVAVPFVVAALVIAAIFGKVALAEWIGGSAAKPFGGTPGAVGAFAIGSVIILLLYMVPILGLIALAFLSLWGLGAAVAASVGGLKREMPEKPGPAAPGTPQSFTPPSGGPLTPMPGDAPLAAATAQPGEDVKLYSVAVPGASTEPAPSSAPSLVAPSPTEPSTPPPAMLPEAYAYPRATFWERMGALFLDLVIVITLGSLVGGAPLGFLVALAYFAGMWAWRGTTIGGIVLGLKVVRYDGKPVTFAVALVRSLVSALSAAVLFLGFIAIFWDRDRQAWHDKVAGTIVLKLPRGIPLLCL